MEQKKYIELDAAIAAIEERARLRRHVHDLVSYEQLKRAKWDINDIPAADVVPVVRGKRKRNERGNYNCSNCQSEYNAVFGFAFCPNCGADMRPDPPKEE